MHVIESFDLIQLVNQPSHVLGGTIDLIMVTSLHLSLIKEFSVGLKNEMCSSDHLPIMFTLDLKPVYEDKKHSFVYRDWSKLSIENVKHSLMTNNMLTLSQDCNVNDTVACYNETMIRLSDQYCPPSTITVTSRASQKWYTEEFMT